MSYESMYYAMTDFTTARTIESFGNLAVILVVAYIGYILARTFKEKCRIWMKSEHNKVYLDDLYTSFKAGYIRKIASEENINLEDIPEPKRKTIADKLKEEVDNEIAN